MDTAGHLKHEKQQITNALDGLDKKVEKTMLTPNEIALKHYLNERLAHMLREEEIKWYQRSKAKELLEGDNNTKYFHLIANGKFRKSQIYKLEDGGNTIQGDDDLKWYNTKYYKGLFGKPDDNTFSLDESRISNIPQVGEQENEILVAPFKDVTPGFKIKPNAYSMCAQKSGLHTYHIENRYRKINISI
jgi:hypothetical protein